MDDMNSKVASGICQGPLGKSSGPGSVISKCALMVKKRKYIPEVEAVFYDVKTPLSEWMNGLFILPESME